MCKTGTTPNKRPAAFASAPPQQPGGIDVVPPTAPNLMSSGFLVSSQNVAPSQYYGGLFNQAAAGFPQLQLPTQFNDLVQLKPNDSPFFRPQTQQQQIQNNLTVNSVGNHPWYQPQMQQQSAPMLNPQGFLGGGSSSQQPSSRSFQECMEILNKPSMSASMPSLIQALPSSMPSSMMSRPGSMEMSSLPELARRASMLKRAMPESIPDSNSEESSHADKTEANPTKKARAHKSKHEATLDGERRVAIEFEAFGKLGVLPQTYGKGALLVPDGVSGKYSAFGQRWRFHIAHAVGPVICEDGVQRMCLSWSVTNLNSGQTHTVVETPMDAMKRDRDGKTLCNRVFRDALSLRASALEAELRNTKDAGLAVDLQSQLRTIQTKRFSEGPLFFGLRHCSLQNEMKKETLKRAAEMGASAAAQVVESKSEIEQ